MMIVHSPQGDSFGCEVERGLAMLFDTTTTRGLSVECEFDGAARDGQRWPGPVIGRAKGETAPGPKREGPQLKLILVRAIEIYITSERLLNG